VDFLGDGQWVPYAAIRVKPHGYEHRKFPAGFGALWLSVTASGDSTADAYLHDS